MADDSVKLFDKIARTGIDIFQEVQQKIFTVDCVTAEIFRNRCVEFIVAFLISSRYVEGRHDITNNVHLVVIEFQKLITRLEERFNNFTDVRATYCCPNESLDTAIQGRPRLLIPQEQLEGLRSLGFSWVTIAKMLGVSERTVRRRKQEYNMSSSTDIFSEISDSEIDKFMKFILQVSPNSGERMIIGWFRGRGIRVQRWRIRDSISRVDPLSRDLRRRTVTVRRIYSVPTPNSLWYDKKYSTS